MLDANLKFISFGFFSQQGDIREHVDSQVDESITGHCNINYVISCTDPNARTYLRNPETGEEEFYPSIPGRTWMLNSTIPHRVVNTGIREVFQLKVFSPFEEVRQFFDSNNWL